MKPVLTGSEQRPHEPRRQSSGENRFPPTLAVVIAAALYTLLPDPIRLGPRLVVPAVEVVLLAALLITNPRRNTTETRTSRWVSLVLAAVVVGTNLVALGLLVADLVAGRADQPGLLLLAGLQVWATSVIGFALVYWEPDRGGPVPPRPQRPAACGLAVLAGRERRRRHRGRDERERPVGVDAGVRGLPLPVADQLQRVQPHRHHAAQQPGEAADGGPGHRGAAGDAGHRGQSGRRDPIVGRPA